MSPPRPHEEVRGDLAAYVVGALAPAERAAVEEHLEACAACRDELAHLAVIPGLLARLTEAEASDGLVEVPDGHDEHVAAAAARRVRRTVRTWRAVAAAAAATAVLALALWRPWAGPSGTRFEGSSVTAQAVSAEVAAFVEEREWGMHVTLRAGGLPDRRGYVLYAVAEDGHRAQVASWAHTGEEVVLEGSCYMQAADAVALQVVARDEVVVTVPLGGRG